MVTFTLSQSVWEFAKSRAIRVKRVTMVYVPIWQTHANFSFLRANVPINVPTYQGCDNYSTWNTNVPKGCQFFSFAYQKVYQFLKNFSKEFFNFSIFQLHVFFYKHGVYKHIQAQVWWFFKHMLSIMLSLGKYYHAKHFSG